MKKGSRGGPVSLAGWVLSQNPGSPWWATRMVARCYSAAIGIASTEQNFRPSLPSWNTTRPSISANSV